MHSLLRSRSLVIAIILWSAIAVTSWKQLGGSLFAWDAFGYHLYLPASFIHQDLLLKDLDWVEEARSKWAASSTVYQLSHFPDGSRVIRYPMGMAVLWTPWFAIGHVVAVLTGFEQDGYSMPYQRSVHAGILCYILLGLLALRKVLLSRFSELITGATLFLVVVGTNLLDQSINAISMPHVVLFALYSGILYFTLKWSDTRLVRHAASLAVLMGLATLVRPTEAVCVLIPLLWINGGEHGSMWARAWRLRRQWLMIAAIMFLIGLPQFAYWYAATGRAIIDSYNNPGEGLDLLSPHTGVFLFSFRKGWYIYTPMMLLATLGIFHLRKNWAQAFIPVLAYFLVNLYLASSWSNWWYADSFGSRAMVGSYAVMALPLAALLRTAVSWRSISKVFFILMLCALVVLNLFQHLQYMRGIIHTSRMTERAYWAGFGQIEPVAGMAELLLVDRSGPSDVLPDDMSGYSTKFLANELLDTGSSPMDTLLSDPLTGSSMKAYRLGGQWEYSPAIRIPYYALAGTDHVWVELTWRIMLLDPASRGSLVTTMEHNERSYGYEAKALDMEAWEIGEWHTIVTHFRTPEMRSTKDILVTYYWAHDTLPILIDGPHLKVLEPVPIQ